MPLPVKIKLDENKVPILEDGNPVFEFDDGTESGIDVVASFKGYETKIGNFDEAKTRHEEKLTKMKADLKAFKGVDIKTYEEGMKKIAAIADQKLLDESGAESLKKSMRAIFDEEVDGIHSSYKKNMTEKDETIENMKTIVYDLAIKNQFASNDHFTGDKPITIYNPEDAAKIYGSHFSVDIQGSKYSIVAKDHSGGPILSKVKHGEPASFAEAITQIIEHESKHKAILRNAKTGGPVTSGNLDSTGITDTTGQSSVQKIKAGLLKHQRNS